MEQMEYGMLNLLQFMTQATRSTEPSAQQSGEQSDFQNLISQKSQTTPTDNTSTATTIKTDKTQTPVSVQDGKTENEDALTRELACAQLLAAQTMPVVAVEETTVQQAVQPEVTATIVTSIEPEIVTPTVVTEQQPTEVLPEQEQDVPADNTQQSPVEVELTTPVENESTPVAATPQSAQTESQPQSEAPVEQQDKQDSEVTVTDAAAAEAQPLFRTIEPHMVKVSETGTTEQTTEAQPPEQQIASRLNDAIEQGDSRVEIQLEPQSLGKVTVELTQHSDGSLHIVLNADNARTHTLLQQHTEGLQQLLGGQDRKPVEIEVQHQERSQDAPNYDGRHGHSQQQQEQQERRPSRQQSSEDFLQQLRLGLVPLEAS